MAIQGCQVKNEWMEGWDKLICGGRYRAKAGKLEVGFKQRPTSTMYNVINV